VTLGTPLYMSPEAVEHPELVDARSDLYSLGAVGYFLLTGGPLFHCGSIGEVLLHQVKHAPEPPSRRLGKSVSPDLEALLLRCLAKDPAVRPGNARELEAALAACRGGGAWLRDDAEDWWRRFAAARNDRTAVTETGA
jgi:serine/threonine protein kinase